MMKSGNWSVMRLAMWTLILGVGLAGGVWAVVDARTNEPSLDGAAIEKQLDTILDNQQLILKQFDAVLEELRIVKIRCTR